MRATAHHRVNSVSMNQSKLNVDEAKLTEFMGKALADMGAAHKYEPCSYR
jgi:hypothetical protein